MSKSKLKSTPNFPIPLSKEELFKLENKGYTLIWTEIIIQKPPAVVRAKFLDFETRPTWDPYYRKMVIVQGHRQINVDKNGHDHLTTESQTKPLLECTIDPTCTGDGEGFRVPFQFEVLTNDEQSFVWGLNYLRGYIFQMDHGHLFLPMDVNSNENENENNGGRGRGRVIATRHVNYYVASGAMKYLVSVPKYTRAFERSNEELKKACEEE